MGIVINQSIKNTIITYIGFGIGAANTLFMYPIFLGAEYYGLTGYILSTANILFPLMAFGAHNTLIKFFSDYKTDSEKNTFFSFLLILPIFLAVLLFIIGFLGYETIVAFESSKNELIQNYVCKFLLLVFVWVILNCFMLGQKQI